MRINRKFLAACRTVHIYLTMFGLFVMLCFGATGFTINHEDWFGATRPRTTELHAVTPKTLIDAGDSLRIVEHVRQSFHITAALTAYDDLGDRLSMGFKSPSQGWEVEIEKSTGVAIARGEAFNAIAILDNLHRGRYSGRAWSWVIDVSAALIVLACITGVVLWMALPKRRMLGIAFMLLGMAAVVAIYLLLVPGVDNR